MRMLVTPKNGNGKTAAKIAIRRDYRSIIKGIKRTLSFFASAWRPIYKGRPAGGLAVGSPRE